MNRDDRPVPKWTGCAETRSVRPAVSGLDFVAFSVLAGLAATFTLGYRYGLNNQIELLLPVLRILDPAFCPGDFAVDAFSGYGPRFYFSWICATLARALSLPGALLAVTLAQNVGIALVTGFAARAMHGAASAAPWVAVALVLAAESIQLGGACFLRQPYGVPANLALAAALGSLWQGIRLRPYVALALAIPAALIHPLVGLETGGVALATCGLSAVFDDGCLPAQRRRIVRHALFALVGLGAFAALAWGTANQGLGRNLQEFMDVYVRFRVPHHVLPSRFPGRDYGMVLAFLIASGFSWHWWRRLPGIDRQLTRGLPIGTAIVLAMLVGGWFFVELVPSRLWATLQTFRLVYVVKWFGLMLFAGTIGRAWASHETGARAIGWLLFLPVGPAQPLAALWAHVVELIRRKISQFPCRWAGLLPAAIGLAIFFAGIAAGPVRRYAPEAFTLLSVGALIAIFRGIRRAEWRLGLSLLWTTTVIGLLLLGRGQPARGIENCFSHARPVLTLADAHDPIDGIARFCRAQLPEDALVVVPPLAGRFRLVAERSILVDFKVFPHHADIGEWRRRMTDCHGATEKAGFPAALEMDLRYRQMADSRLFELARRYGVSHAVLYRATETEFPVLYGDASFQLVKISGPPASQDAAAKES